MDDIFDEPIYLLTSSFIATSPTPPTLYWFVIEDWRNSNIIQNLNPNPNRYDYQLEADEVEAVELSENYSDIFRSLPPFPNLSSHIFCTKLVIINSRIYMLGGHDLLFHKKRRDPILSKHTNVRFFDFHNPSCWQIGPSFPSPQSMLDVATSDNGSILVIGTDSSNKKKCLLWLESLTSTWKVLPNPPNKLLVFSESVKLLALTDTHIFCTFESKSGPHNYGLRFSLVNKEWEVFDKRSFNGFWSKGVVLYDKYLVLYGCNIRNPQFIVRGMLFVYDLEDCRWVLMDSPAKGIQAFPPHCSDHYLRPNILFRVAHNKFAFIWQNVLSGPISKSPDTHFHLFCTKFILHKTSTTKPPPTRRREEIKNTGTEPPPFYFEVFSHGVYRVGSPMMDPAVRLSVKGTS